MIFRFSMVSCGAMVAALYAAAAVAQTAPAGGDPAAPAAADTSPASAPGDCAPGEIVVTAQKRSESINKVPLSIVAATGDQLIALGVRQPSDLTKIVSGFQATTSQIGTPVYYLRGVGYDDIAVAARPTVTLYNDEAPLPYSAMAIGTSLDLERVEVLKGPQGLLFGSNSTGGAINFVAAKPTDHLTAGVDASIGRFNENNVSGFVSGPANDWLGVRLAVAHEGMGNWQYDYVDGKTIGQRNNWSGRATFVANPNAKFSARLTCSERRIVPIRKSRNTSASTRRLRSRSCGRIRPRPATTAPPASRPARSPAWDCARTIIPRRGHCGWIIISRTTSP